MTSKHRLNLVIAGSLMTLLIAGCSKGVSTDVGKETSAAQFDTSKPVKLSFYMSLAQPDEWIQKYIIEPAQKKYPNITIDIVRKGKGTNPDELVAAGNFPDIFYESIPRYTPFKDLGLLYDMNDFIKKYKFDVSKLNPAVVDALKMWGDKGELYQMPLWMNYSALYYNKDIFDKFGVPYPQDGMTWDQAIEISRKITRKQDGVTYRGLDPNSITAMTTQMSLPYVDSNNKALIDSDGMRKVFQTFLNAYKIPGNEVRNNARDSFTKDKTLAMYPFYADAMTWIAADAGEKSGNPLNWDMVTLPGFAEKPGLAYEVDSHNLAISNTSQNKEAAFMVISYLTSKEPQLALTKEGHLPVLNDAEIIKSFGQDKPELKGKHLDAILKSKPAPLHKFSRYDSQVTKQFGTIMKDLEQGNDLNTAIRTANEAANMAIQQQIDATKAK